MSACTLKKTAADIDSWRLPISSVTPFTMQDFPDHTACILWFSGCNFRCDYCHNPELVCGELKWLKPSAILEFLEARQGLLEGVVLSGGECTLSPGIVLLARLIKDMGFKLKVDTNGSRPEVIFQLAHEKLLDYAAVDYKAPLTKIVSLTKNRRSQELPRTLAVLLASGIPFEIRTTVHADLLDEADVNIIIADLERIKYRGKYYIQNFKDGETLGHLAPPSRPFDISKLTQPTSFQLNYRNF